MTANFHFYEDTFTQLNGSLSTYVSDVATNIIGAISPVATTLISIYVMLYGWSMMRGVISEPITDGVSRIVRLSLITEIALNIGYYNGYLADMLWNSPDALAGFVASGSSSTATNAQFLDNLMSQIYDIGAAYWQKAFASTAGISIPIPNIGLLIIAFLIWLAGLITTAYAAFLLALSKMALAILLGVGPMFVLLTIFEPTKRFFDSWIGQSLNYVFLTMLTASAIKLILTIIKTYLTAASGAGISADPSIGKALPIIALCSIAVLVLMQLSSIASALGGGASIGTLGAAAWAYGKTKGAMSQLRPTNMRRSLNTARSDVRIAKDTARKVGGVPKAVYRRITGGNKNKVAKG